MSSATLRARFIHTLRTPGWRRATLLRRLSAGLLGFIALTLVIMDLRDRDPEVLVLARDVPAGRILDDADLTLAPLAPRSHPGGVLLPNDRERAKGSLLAAEGRAGEVLHDGHLVGPELINSLYPGGTMVPLRLADPELSPLLVSGDTVSVVTARAEDSAPEVVAEGARVVTAPRQEESASILIVLDEPQAQAVAAAALRSPLAVIVTGARARG